MTLLQYPDVVRIIRLKLNAGSV